ncbi:acetyltransferase [Streptomyces sp. NBC_00289]|uniref:GNAT family N-acetyltransferase n=1 Tax=Streptomyces sp. NBC_00289 TaxID=2975703 RepID=UPI00324DD8DE
MPPNDASNGAGTAPITHSTATATATGESLAGSVLDAGSDSEDTLELRLPDELIALLEEERAELDRTQGRLKSTASPAVGPSAGDDLLDGVAGWGPTDTPAGVFQLVPVRVERDLALVSRWMNDPAVAAFWDLAGAQSVAEHHMQNQIDGDGRSVPCIGMLAGNPMSYWEIYRADLDPLARHYPARPHDTGIHLLLGGVADRGRGLGSTLLRAVADLVLDKRPACARVVAEPDLRNMPSIASFLAAGFRFSAEIDLPAKQAALVVRDRSLRHLL